MLRHLKPAGQWAVQLDLKRLVGGAAYLVSKSIRKSRVVAFEDLGMEAIHEFEVEDMPVTVAVDSKGESVHQTGPRVWRSKIGKIPLAED